MASTTLRLKDGFYYVTLRVMLVPGGLSRIHNAGLVASLSYRFNYSDARAMYSGRFRFLRYLYGK